MAAEKACLILHRGRWFPVLVAAGYVFAYGQGLMDYVALLALALFSSLTVTGATLGLLLIATLL